MKTTVWQDEEHGITINFKDDEFFPYTDTACSISATKDNEPITLDYTWIKKDLLNVKLQKFCYQVRCKYLKNKINKILFFKLEKETIAISNEETPSFTFIRMSEKDRVH
jgi:hypothetical protein